MYETCEPEQRSSSKIAQSSVLTSTTKKSAFLQRINHPTASDIVGNIKKFIQKVLQTPTSILINGDSKIIREFLDSMEETMKQHPLWKSCTDEEINESNEGLEKFVTLNLHSKLFGNREEERTQDSLIYDKISSLHWISLEHMEINSEVSKEKLSIDLACSG